MIEVWLGRPHIVTFTIVFVWGLYLMVAHHNLIRKLIGMYLVQNERDLLVRHVRYKNG